MRQNSLSLLKKITIFHSFVLNNHLEAAFSQ